MSTSAAAPGDIREATDGDRPKHTPWYRRRAALLALGTIVVVAVTVITDLPVHTSNASDIAAEQAVMSEVNTDLSPCGYAVRESLAIRSDQMAGEMTPSDRRQATGILRDDLAACSFTDNSIYDLSNVEPPGSAAGKRVGELVNTVTLWATSDAIGAISDVELLVGDPGDAAGQNRPGVRASGG